MTPYFSVVTPSFNQGPWIEGNIRSVLDQGFTDFEHIIFDNCSTDETPAVLARHAHLDVHIEPDRGQSHALNKGFQRARGEVICWLNADDQYLPGTLARVRQALSQPGVDIVFGDAQEIYFDGKPGGIRRAKFERREDLLRWWWKKFDLLQPAVFFRRSIFERVGYLREDLYIIMDHEFWWRVAEHYRFHRIEAPLALQQRLPDSKTVRHMARIYEEKARVFGPLLDAAEPQRILRNRIARRLGMGRRWLGLAQSAATVDKPTARDLHRRATEENPLLAFTPRWWSVLLHTR